MVTCTVVIPPIGAEDRVHGRMRADSAPVNGQYLYLPSVSEDVLEVTKVVWVESRISAFPLVYTMRVRDLEIPTQDVVEIHNMT